MKKTKINLADLRSQIVPRLQSLTGIVETFLEEVKETDKYTDSQLTDRFCVFVADDCSEISVVNRCTNLPEFTMHTKFVAGGDKVAVLVSSPMLDDVRYPKTAEALSNVKWV